MIGLNDLYPNPCTGSRNRGSIRSESEAAGGARPPINGTEPLVSVIVPVYNVEALLPRCLDSLLKQTLTGIEIICVNDASPDGSLAVLRDYERRFPRVRVIDLPRNVRQGGARNRGLDAARGKYIAFADSDDCVAPSMYERLYRKAEETEADVVSCDFDVLSPDGQVLDRQVTDKSRFCGEIGEELREEFCLLGGSCCCNLLRRDFLKAHPMLRFPEGIAYEDNYFALLLHTYIRTYHHLPECLYHYCRNEESTTRQRNSPRLRECFRSLDLRIGYFEETGLAERYPRALDYTVVRCLYNMTTMHMDRFDRPEADFLNEIHARLKAWRKRRGRWDPFVLSRMTAWEKRFLWLLERSPRLFRGAWSLRCRMLALRR